METVETRNDRRWWILAVLCLSVLLTVVDNTIVSILYWSRDCCQSYFTFIKSKNFCSKSCP